jgi:uncharacterized membrane protein
VRHHARFYLAALLGLLVWATAPMLQPPLRLVVAGDALFASYLATTALMALRATPDAMRRRADYEDEGMILVIVLTLGAISVSLASIFTLVVRDGSGALLLAFTVASVPLGWLTLHTVAAFRYAHLYYTQRDDGGGDPADAGGLAFPETREPGTWDFLYYAFVVGMTAQVSDVQVLSTDMRRLTLAHSVTSFFFNTVLLALAVNIAATYAQ